MMIDRFQHAGYGLCQLGRPLSTARSIRVTLGEEEDHVDIL